MQLLSAHLRHMGPLENHTFRFGDEGERPQAVTCILGGAGTGKSSLLGALASTRPGYAAALTRVGASRAQEPSWALSEWLVGDDDPARPHPLVVATPGAAQDGEREDRVQERRREQVLFERKAAEGGYVFIALPGCRWFSRSPISISVPERLLGRYDVRAPTSFDDATRSDLARETKQVLSLASLGAALAARAGAPLPVTRLDDALRAAVSELTSLVGYAYEGADPASLEPVFKTTRGELVPFDELPTGARHLASFAALPLRALHAAYGRGDPLACEGVVVIDDVELHQDASTQRALPAALKRAIPRVQWIVTTSSSHVALGCEPEEVIALRRMMASGAVELHTGSLALVH